MDLVHKVNPETQDTTFVRNLDNVVGGSPRGCFITNHYDSRSAVFMCISDNADSDRIDIYQLDGNTRWLDFQPDNGALEADASEIMDITIRSEGFFDVWEGEIVFSHNAPGGETILPVTMTVFESADDNYENTLPSDFGITSVYPNPFNSSVTIGYNLEMESNVTLKLFDITGREVMTLLDDETQTAGKYSTVLNGSALPAGLYFIRLQTENSSSIRKIVLMK
jgi:hypothetical protein